MGEMIEFENRLAQVCKDDDVEGFQTFLLTEGLELLADFRSIEDAAVRQSIKQMVSKIAAALRPNEGVEQPR